jgi:hypothetical protein
LGVLKKSQNSATGHHCLLTPIEKRDKLNKIKTEKKKK